MSLLQSEPVGSRSDRSDPGDDAVLRALRFFRAWGLLLLFLVGVLLVLGVPLGVWALPWSAVPLGVAAWGTTILLPLAILALLAHQVAEAVWYLR